MRNEDQNFEKKISGLLGSLARVEPPKDFDFKVRSRIAQGRPSPSNAWLPTSVKVAVPLGLTLMVGAYVGVTSLYGPQANEQGQVAAVPVAEPAPMAFVPVAAPPVTTAAEVPQDVAAADTAEIPEARKPLNTAVRKTSNSRRSAEPVGGSVDSALRETTTILPPGVNSNAALADPAASEVSVPKTAPAAARISGREVLSGIGVSAVFSGGSWLVQSVNADSLAGRAGVKVGDIVEAVNGRALSNRAAVESGSPPRGLRVRRDGRTVFIGLTP